MSSVYTVLDITQPCCPPQCVNNGVYSNLIRIKVKQAVKYKNVRSKRQIMWHESYIGGEYRCSWSNITISNLWNAINPYHHINVVSTYILPGLLVISHEETWRGYRFLEVNSNTCIYLKNTQIRIFSLGQRHVILSPIDAHYKWPQNKIYSYVS